MAPELCRQQCRHTVEFVSRRGPRAITKTSSIRAKRDRSSGETRHRARAAIYRPAPPELRTLGAVRPDLQSNAQPAWNHIAELLELPGACPEFDQGLTNQKRVSQQNDPARDASKA
jgi:hypothetical protein